jgi:mono/diheme cytochrome c family protein
MMMMMDALFWQRLHGGSTHFPIVLLPLSVIFDFVGLRLRDDKARRAFHIAGAALAFAGVSGGAAALIAGLVMTHGDTLGHGAERLHHLFAWPGFFLSIVLVAWRHFPRRQVPPGRPRTYLVGMSIASALMLGAGYWGGEMLLHTEPENDAAPSGLAGNEPSFVRRGYALFLRNCARCHGDEARGTDEGPDLTQFHKSEARFASVVNNGIKGEMPRFAQKLTDTDVKMLIHFIRSLNREPTCRDVPPSCKRNENDHPESRGSRGVLKW